MNNITIFLISVEVIENVAVFDLFQIYNLLFVEVLEKGAPVCGSSAVWLLVQTGSVVTK